ncbi:type IV pilus secretin PilQ [Chitinilyticum piscinae]|uniref:Type IV pilus secretin PilQ n=1 Tax=Chitinilyticum piscinae TaxID=2866724 RepID=A0A8J7FGT8_9NEIS|nr:type IV pilus secretin PilQ [Chitinilyticum piscinae]MBE9607890.1 type IV pilus secretin PilQ [Chitinilyticum piscinae]
MIRTIKYLGLLVLSALSVVVYAEQSALTAVDVTSESAERQVVKLTFSGQPPVPTSFVVKAPPRIALDFANVANQAGKNAVQVNGAAVRTLNIAEGSGRTRVVLNLAKSAGYTTETQGNTVLVVVDAASVEASSGTSSKTTIFSETKAVGKKESIQNIDFRRGANGEGKIVVDLSSPNVGIDIRQQGKNLLVDFSKASLAKALERRMDVTDFGTPVQKVDAYAQGDQVKMVIEPKGNWEYSAYQTENRFVIEVRDASADKAALSSQKNYKGEKLSLNFQNVEIRTVLQVIAEFTGMNVITSDTVNGALTLRLKDVPWDQALDIILQAKGLDMRKSGNVLWIAPRDELAAKEKQELETKKQISELEPTRTEYFRLKYHRAEAFEKILKDDKQKLLSPRGSAVIDERTNTLIIQDIPTKLEQIRDVVEKLDIPVRQVMIEARIVEASDGFARNLGVKWHGIGWKGDVTTGGGITTKDYDTVSGDKAKGPAIDGSKPQINLGAAGLNDFAAASLGFLIKGSDGMLALELSAMEADGLGKVVSSPRVMTADGQEAKIEEGQEAAFTETAPNGATTTTFKKAVLSLKVKPQITPDGNVIMDVKVNKDNFENVRLGLLNTKQVETIVRVENGGTVVIGGIYITEEAKDVTKVPLLGDIPGVGNLFKNTSTSTKKRELLVFLTPKVIDGALTLR